MFFREWLREEGGGCCIFCRPVTNVKKTTITWRLLYLRWNDSILNSCTWQFNIAGHRHRHDAAGICLSGYSVSVRYRTEFPYSGTRQLPASPFLFILVPDWPDAVQSGIRVSPAMPCKQHTVYSRNSGEINLQRTAFEVLDNSQVFTSLTMQFGPMRLWGAALYTVQ